VRRALLLVLLAIGLAGCGGAAKQTASPTTTTTPPPAAAPKFAGAAARTTAAGPVRFRLLITINAGGALITAEENGSAAFAGRRAHLYKQLPGGQFPQELVIIGPFTYTNANVQAALSDPSVQPWTKLDTRRLTATQRRTQPDELTHVLAPAYLSDGVAVATAHGREANGTYRFTGVVNLARLARRVPATIRTAVRNDFPAANFPATFWLDARGRLARVLVAYTTPKGTQVGVDATYRSYGAKVDLTLPAARKIKDISP
jgi:hypothetical protein